MHSPKFNEYYSKQFAHIMGSDEFYSQFLKTLQEKLPVTFRINSGEVGFDKVCAMLRDKDFIETFCKRVEETSAQPDADKPETAVVEESKEGAGAFNMD